MKTTFLLISILLEVSAFAQTGGKPVEGSNWARVQAIAPGSSIHVSAKHGGASCRMKVADAASLTCIAGTGDRTFQRGDVKSVQLRRRGVSTAVGAGIGAGIGAGVGAAVDGALSGTYAGGKKARSAGIGAMLGIVIITPIGYFSDLCGSTVYRAP